MLPYALFFVSGFAALSYQILWQRLLVIFSGSDVESATIIVAAFMAGLGCGSLAGGRLADRWSPATNLGAFAAAELGIAVFGAISATIYYDLLYRRLGEFSWSLQGTAVILFASLCWPTFLMGASLPLLVRALTRGIEQAAATGGTLYAFNTLGGAAGALVTTWLFMPNFGLQDSLLICAALNLVAAISIVPLALKVRRTAIAAPVVAGRDDDGARRPVAAPYRVEVPFVAWTLMYALAGFLALSLEIVWFRLMGVLLKSSAYVFGTLIAQYLLGLGLGAAVSSVLVGRSRRPAWSFVIIQAAIGMYAGLGLLVLLAMAGDSAAFPWLSAYLSTYEPLDARRAIEALANFARAGDAPHEVLALYVILPALLIGPPTALMGAAFPLLQKAVQTDLQHVGRRIGALLMANIAGSALGSFVTGWLALSWLGTAGTLKALVAVSAIFPLVGLVVLSRLRPARVALASALTIAAVGALLVAMPDSASLWARLHGASPASIVHDEDGSGLSLLKVEPSNFRSRVAVFANGASQSWIPYGGIHTVLGALPAFMHPDPRTAAVIGLGSGDTLFAIAGRHEIERIQCVEIIRPQLGTLKRLNKIYPYPALDSILTDPRIEHLYGDGRLHVVRSRAKYDLIEADALRPASAYSGNLYSDEYFAMLRDHLAPGGLAVTWSPTPRVRDTFLKVFPHALKYEGLLVGSDRPIGFDPDAIRRRLAEPRVKAYFDSAGVDIAALLEPYLASKPVVFDPTYDRSGLRDINTDLFPKDEYGVPFGARAAN